MTDAPIQALDVIALTVDLPNGLSRGQVGTVVHIHAPDAFEVEFIDNDGRTYAVATVRADQLLRLQFSPAEAA